MRVAVIGAGVSGLSTARVLSERGHKVTIFERKSEVGGVWKISRRHAGLKLQSPKEFYEFSDFSMPPDYCKHPSAEQILKYIKSFAVKHNLLGMTRFGTAVIRISSQKNGVSRWEVLSQEFVSGKANKESFDHVVICSGIFGIPLKPEFPGTNFFIKSGGRIFHSSEFNNQLTSEAIDKDIVVLGFGKSALDIATTCIGKREA